MLGDDYTVADIATWPWVNNLVGFYGAADLVGWADFRRTCSVCARPSWPGRRCSVAWSFRPDPPPESLPMPLPPVQAAIVDLDGTMVDTVGDFEVALGRMLADLGLRRSTAPSSR
jgi:hypothetical protein